MNRRKEGEWEKEGNIGDPDVSGISFHIPPLKKKRK